MYKSDELRKRWIEGMQRWRGRGGNVRVALLDALNDGSELSSPELQAKLLTGPPLSVVNYHLAVLREARTVGCVDGLYRLA